MVLLSGVFPVEVQQYTYSSREGAETRERADDTHKGRHERNRVQAQARRKCG